MAYANSVPVITCLKNAIFSMMFIIICGIKNTIQVLRGLYILFISFYNKNYNIKIIFCPVS